MSDFTNDLDGMEFGTYQDDEQRGDGIVRIQWRQGDPKAQTPGYFFLAADNVPDDFTPGAPWVETSEYFEMTRSRSQGWKADELPVCIICARAQPYQRGDVKIWIDKWPKGAPSNTIGQHADVLLIAQGLEALGPVCWSTNSTTVAFAIISGADPKRNPQGGILYRVREEVLKPAGEAFKPKRDLTRQPWLFWVTIHSQRTAKGAVVFTPTAGKDVTLPVAAIPDVVDLPWLRKAYSGKDMAQYGEDMRLTYDIWKNTKFTNDAQPTPAGRNAPQPITVDADDVPVL